MRRRLLFENGGNGKPIANSDAADIALYDISNNRIIIADGQLYNSTLYPTNKYTPIGVVAVPASHAPNGRARVISLAAMDYSNPDSGDTEGHVNIVWGGYGFTVSDLPLLTQEPYINSGTTTFDSEQTLKGFIDINSDWDDLSSDYFTYKQNPFDTKSYYYSNSVSYCIPSPFLEDGTPNPIYRDTTNTGNVFADFDGKGNTAKILAVDNNVSTDWQTASTISNVGSTEYVHPAAQCCWRYHTVGTNQGDWYLPSTGELGYVVARRKAIDASIQKIIDNGTPALLLTSNDYWCSTQYSSNHAVIQGLLIGYVGERSKDENIYIVRCFLEV